MTKKIAVKEVLSARKVNLSFLKYPEDILMTISSLQREKQFQNLPGRCMLDMSSLQTGDCGLLWRERDKFHGSRSWISFYSRRVRRLKYSSFIFIFKISYRPEFHITTRDFYIYQNSHERRWFTKISDRFLNFPGI